METSVTHTTETVSGKKYPLTIIRQHGLQKIEVGGTVIEVVDVTIFESPLGKSRCYTRAQLEPTPEERTKRRREIKEIATKAMIDQGIW